MGLRCSLFGHDFGDTLTERDRDERGAEVVITVREIRTCRRCGAEEVVTENTEVRHRDSLSDAAGGGESDPSVDGDLDGEASESEAATATTDFEPAVDDIETDSDVDAEPDEETDTSPDPAADDPDHDVASFVEAAEPGKPEAAGEADVREEQADPDDMPGFEEASPESTAETGEEADDAPGAETTSGPDESADTTTTAEGESDGVLLDETDESDETTDESDEDEEDATEDVDDAVIMDETNEGVVDRDTDLGRREMADAGNMFDTAGPRGERAAPEDPSDGTVWEPDEESATSDPPGIGEDEEIGADANSNEDDPGTGPGTESMDESAFEFDSQQSEEPGEAEPPEEPRSGITSAGPIDVSGRASDDPDASLRCPECGHTVPAARSSLRAGDICPECHRAYLTERR
jgi:ssDNA-binding Zn-finger/Zn-ribbon topoisomerase 1